MSIFKGKVYMGNILRIVIVITFIVCGYDTLTMAQTARYEKEKLFSLNWGKADNQLEFRKNMPGEPEGSLIGPTNFTVTPNGLIWVYDVPQMAIKAFDTTGNPLYNYKLDNDYGIEGFISSDSGNNIWFHSGLERRIIKLNPKGELLYAIEFESAEVLGNFYIINDKPVMMTNILIDIDSKVSDNAYNNKPLFRGHPVHVDSSSEYFAYRGKKTKRAYQIKDSEATTTSLLIDNEAKDLGLTKYAAFYYTFFIKEDASGKIFIILYPKSKINTMLMVFNEDCSYFQSIELPEPPYYYKYLGNPLQIDDNGNVYYMQLRSDCVTFFKWSIRD
jgi:hypothetical protein